MANPAYRNVHDVLQRDILAGKLRAGAALPSEERLCRRFKVSRITVRHALRLLRDQGLVESRQGSGTIVRGCRPAKLRILEGQFARSVRRQAPGMQRRLLTRVVAPARSDVAEALRLAPDQPCLLAERLDLLEGEPLAYDQAYIPLPLAKDLDDDMLVRVDFLEAWVAANHLKLSHAMQSIEAALADAAIARRLAVAARSAVLLTREVMFRSGNRPVALFDSVYRGDRFKLVSSIAVAAESNHVQNDHP